MLVKKRDEEETSSTPIPSSITSRPEVYFVKYKSKQEAVDTITNAAKEMIGYGRYNGGGYDEFGKSTHQDTIGYDKFDKVGKPTGLISGGSISDALLGVGAFAEYGKDNSGKTIEEHLLTSSSDI